jgi:hypothetical protein
MAELPGFGRLVADQYRSLVLIHGKHLEPIKMKLLLFVCICLMSFVASAETITHLSTTTYTTGTEFTTMLPSTSGAMEFDVVPKVGNKTWTSIKSCLGARPGTHTYVKTTLTNLDTGEIYYWSRNGANNACTKETFDIPVHTFHRLRLRMVCWATDVPIDRLDYCRGWVILSSSIQEIMP